MESFDVVHIDFIKPCTYVRTKEAQGYAGGFW